MTDKKHSEVQVVGAQQEADVGAKNDDIRHLGVAKVTRRM